MAREGHGRPAIMKATGISERLARSICRQHKKNAPLSTGHVESADSNTAGRSKRGVPFDHVQQSADSKSYHKGVCGMLINLLSDGEERRTSDIVAAIDAHERKVKDALKKLEKTGEIIKVRHGVYAIPQAEHQRKDATMEFQTDIPKAEWDAAIKEMVEGASTDAGHCDADAEATIEPGDTDKKKVDLDEENDIVYIADMGDGRARVSQHKKDTHRRFVIVDLEAQLPSADPTEEDGYYVVVAWELLKTGFF